MDQEETEIKMAFMVVVEDEMVMEDQEFVLYNIIYKILILMG